MIKVTLFQKSLREGINLTLFKRLVSQKSDFLLLPEYFYADSGVKEYRELLAKSNFALDWLLKLSDLYKGTIIGGSLLIQEGDQYYSAMPVLTGGSVVDWYKKRDLNAEEKKFLTPGAEASVFVLHGHRFSTLIGSDMLNADYLKEIQSLDIKLLFSSYNSFADGGHDEKLFCDAAKNYGICIAKCCSTGDVFGEKLKGRSMVVSPSGVTWRVSPGEEDQEILKTLFINIPGA